MPQKRPLLGAVFLRHPGKSGMLCAASFPRMIRHFDFDGTDAAMPGLCEDVLDFLQ